jgi:hypothetical protein
VRPLGRRIRAVNCLPPEVAAVKDLAPWYFPPSEDEFWQDCVFVFDTSALLSLYKFTKASRDEFLGVLEKIGERLWLPHHVAWEVMKNRLDVIQDLRALPNRIIDKLKASLKEMRKDEAAEGWHTAAMVKMVDERLAALSADLNKSLDEMDFSLQADGVLVRLDPITKDRVGPQYSEDTLKEKLKDAKERMDNLVPPGYADFKKKIKDHEKSTAPNPNNAYGDLVIWHQLIDYCAAAKGRRIAFVTNDVKEDWLHKTDVGVVGPRGELLEELYTKGGGAHLRVYTTARFLQLAKDKLSAKVHDKTIKEAEKAVLGPIRNGRRLRDVRVTKLDGTIEPIWFDDCTGEWNHLPDPIHVREAPKRPGEPGDGYMAFVIE